jgi:hypothetical protein
MDDKKLQLLPYNVINEFMLPEYRMNVLQSVFGQFDQLEPSLKGRLTGMVKKYVTVAGFRNSSVAPTPVKVKASVSAFERKSDFVSAILFAWCNLHPDLREKIYDLLKARNWEVLPADVDRSTIPGFMITWPKDESYEALQKNYREKYPQDPASDDDIILMAIWLAGRLHYQMTEPE